MISILKFTKGHNYVKHVGGISVLVLCISSDYALNFTKLNENTSKGSSYWADGQGDY